VFVLVGIYHCILLGTKRLEIEVPRLDAGKRWQSPPGFAMQGGSKDPYTACTCRCVYGIRYGLLYDFFIMRIKRHRVRRSPPRGTTPFTSTVRGTPSVANPSECRTSRMALRQNPLRSVTPSLNPSEKSVEPARVGSTDFER
jgi:hypothetical protein